MTVLLMVVLCLFWAQSANSKPSLHNTEAWNALEIASGGSGPYKPTSHSWQSADSTVFVGISAFRDKRCGQTLKSLFLNAEHPERITVGVIEHIHTENDHSIKCMRDYCSAMGVNPGSGKPCPHESQITVMDVSFLDARGPGMTRVMQENLLGDEEFCLQVDAHSKFAKNWDTVAMNEWGKTANEYAIISSVPPDVKTIDKSVGEMNHICQATFTSYGMVRNLAPRKLKDMDGPVLAPLWSAAMSFSKCHAVRKVPYDPNLHFIFDGEEFSRMARFWTKGYDVYSPSRVIVAHDYDDENLGLDDKKNAVKSGSWSSNGQTPEYRWMMYEHATQRIKTLLGQDLGKHGHAGLSWMRSAQDLSLLTKYGLGTRRTLDQFIEFTGLDPKSGNVLGDRCKGLTWVPHKTLATKATLIDPALDEGDPWGMAGEPAHAGGENVPLSVGPGSSLDLQLYRAAKHGSDGSTPSIIRGTTTGNSNGGVVAESSPEGGMLWFLFLPVDWAVQSLMQRIEGTRPGQGLRLTKILLLGVPLVLGVFIAGVWALVGETDRNTPRDSPLPAPRIRSPEKMV